MDQSQPLAYLDTQFLESDEARPLRILSEYLEPLRRFQAENVEDTVVFFGSARMHSREDVANGTAPGLNGRAHEWASYYEDARTLASQLTTWSCSLNAPHHRFVVCTGGGPGIMEAANRGASEAGGKSIGLNIALPTEQDPNPYITKGLQFEFHYFFMRKFWMAYLAKALVVFPGGFGTMDELFEALTLVQTQKLDRPMLVLLYGSDYWDSILRLEPMVQWGAIQPGDLSLFQRVDTPADAFAALKAHLLKHCLECPEPPGTVAPRIARTRSHGRRNGGRGLNGHA